jgi:hypothetical protein
MLCFYLYSPRTARFGQTFDHVGSAFPRPVAAVGKVAGRIELVVAEQYPLPSNFALCRCRQKLAREFDATAIVTERGDEEVARIMEITRGASAEVRRHAGTDDASDPLHSPRRIRWLRWGLSQAELVSSKSFWPARSSCSVLPLFPLSPPHQTPWAYVACRTACPIRPITPQRCAH